MLLVTATVGVYLLPELLGLQPQVNPMPRHTWTQPHTRSLTRTAVARGSSRLCHELRVCPTLLQHHDSGLPEH